MQSTVFRYAVIKHCSIFIIYYCYHFNNSKITLSSKIIITADTMLHESHILNPYKCKNYIENFFLNYIYLNY